MSKNKNSEISIRQATMGIYKGPTASLEDFQNPCFLRGNSRKVHENFVEKKKSPLHPKAFLQYLKSLLFPRKIRKKLFIKTFL